MQWRHCQGNMIACSLCYSTNKCLKFRGTASILLTTVHHPSKHELIRPITRVSQENTMSKTAGKAGNLDE